MADDPANWLHRLGRLVPTSTTEFAAGYTDGVDLYAHVYYIGRGPGANVKVHLSKRATGLIHAIIRWSEDMQAFTIEDHGSMNGTYVKGRKIEAPVALENRTAISLGPPNANNCGFTFYGLEALDDIVRKYITEYTIGAGSFGRVYQVRLRADPSRVYAVKVTRYCTDEEEWSGLYSQQQALDEAHALRIAGDHPNVCSFVEYFVLPARATVCIVTPRYSTDLFTRYQNCRPTLAEGQSIMWQVLTGLAHIHGLNIVHQDLKPSNIFVEGNQVLIGDFGLVAAPENCNGAGTVWYTAPEGIRKMKLRNPTGLDDFSAGVNGFHLFMGNLFKSPWDIAGPAENTVESLLEWVNVRCIRLVPLYEANLPNDGETPIHSHHFDDSTPNEALDVLIGLSNPDPDKRWNVKRALESPWIAAGRDVFMDAIENDTQPTAPYAHIEEGKSISCCIRRGIG
ncbi:unnamed protein product [Peniophora sp. CBMAI 1063]|nr:unnamed protein product [Peniophora sp. CBMAI 1063]